MNPSLHTLGQVFLVGAGPGDPGLLTLRGAQLLATADLVLYDYLVNPQLLEHAAPDARRVCLGKHGGGRLWSQDEINAQMIAAALAGQQVVRLKAGDPMVFARAAEELTALAAAGVRVEIVPGVTAALAAPSYAGIAVTHRDEASAVALVTGHEDPEKAASALDYAALAAFPGTLVIYMGVTTARQWSAALVEHGKSPTTPVAIVRRVSWPNQLRIDTTLGQVSEVVEQRKLRPPAVFVIGESVGTPLPASWFRDRPLVGQRVLVTRSAEQEGDLRDRLQALGAEVFSQPAIEIIPPDDWGPVDAVLRAAGDFDWIVFSSANGVRHFLDRLAQLGGDGRWLAGARLAAIGPGTATELARNHLRADLIPDEHRAEALAEALLAGEAPLRSSEHARRHPVRALLVRASRGRETLAEQLAASGWQVTQVVAYHSVDVAEPDAELAARLQAGDIDWVTVTSSAIARSLAKLFGPALARTKRASISPITSGVLRELGLPPAAEAREYTMAGLVAAMVEYSAGQPSAPRSVE